MTVASAALSESASAQSSCFHDGDLPETLPAGSPPTVLGGGDIFNATGGGQTAAAGYVINSASVDGPWATLSRIQQALPDDVGGAWIRFDVGGLAPGCYSTNEHVTYTEPEPDGMIETFSITIVIDLDLTVTNQVQLIDPIPELVGGSGGTAVDNTSELQGLLDGGTVVDGAAADGVTQVIVRIQTNSPNEQFTVTLLNDQSPPAQSTSTDEDGALGNPGDTSFSQSQITVTAGSANSDGAAHAFAVYRAPIDFARPAGTDDQLATRFVFIQVKDITTPSAPEITVPVFIVRPPVMLIHGLWSDWTTWNNFAPLVTGPNTVDTRFQVTRINYDMPVSVSSSVPAYTGPSYLLTPSGNSLGFNYNAPIVLKQIEEAIQDFKARSGVAAIQADVVAHSMGGDITRTIATLPQFLSDFQNPTLGQGTIHKIITIDTPHLGSPLATRLLTSQESCMQGFLAFNGLYTYNSVTLSNGTVSGAIADLQGDSAGVESQALQAIANPGPHALPTAFVVGVYSDFASVQSTVGAITAFEWCGATDPLAQILGENSGAWPTIFVNSEENDAVVSVNSQMNGLGSDLGFVYSGLAHSKGIEHLGFSSPNVLDPGPSNPIPQTVITLLNTPVNTSTFILLNP